LKQSYSCGKLYIFPLYKSKILLQQLNMHLPAKISEAFIGRPQDLKCEHMELDIFATLFSVTAAAVPSNFQHEIMELQTDDTERYVS